LKNKDRGYIIDNKMIGKIFYGKGIKAGI